MLGERLYEHVTDRLFGVPGEWNINQCRTCRLIWLDPMPITEDLPKLYTNYYTHKGSIDSDHRASGLFVKLYRAAQRGYLARKYNYMLNGIGVVGLLLSLIFNLLPNRRIGLDYPFKWLSKSTKGRMLEIGCGAGTLLNTMGNWGWAAEGIDFDSAAVEGAKDAGLDVTQGDLLSQGYDDAAFDAVVISHVVEHLPNPIDTLRECRRILKTAGVLLIITPNSESLGHRLFKRDWRGLEPPRHLKVYNQRAMRELVREAGMGNAQIFSHGRGGIHLLKQSYCLKRYFEAVHDLTVYEYIYLELIWFSGWMMTKCGKDKGEELIMVWHKED